MRAAPEGGQILKFAPATVRHLLETVHANTIAKRLPPDTRRVLNTAYPQTVVLDNALHCLWWVRGSTLQRVDAAMIHELFLAYIARVPPILVTPYSTIPHSPDMFVTLWATTIKSRVDSKSGRLNKPSAIVQLTGSEDVSDSDSSHAEDAGRRVCSWNGCCVMTNGGPCSLHAAIQRAKRWPFLKQLSAHGYDAAAVEAKFDKSVNNAISAVISAASDSARRSGDIPYVSTQNTHRSARVKSRLQTALSMGRPTPTPAPETARPSVQFVRRTVSSAAELRRSTNRSARLALQTTRARSSVPSFPWTAR